MNKLTSIFYELIKDLFVYLFIFIWLFICLCILVPLYIQFIEFINYGFVYPKDLFWFFANEYCVSNTNQSIGLDGVHFNFLGSYGHDICRENNLVFTNLIGLNLIINWFFDIHISVVIIVLTVIFLILIGLIARLINNSR